MLCYHQFLTIIMLQISHKTTLDPIYFQWPCTHTKNIFKISFVFQKNKIKWSYGFGMSMRKFIFWG